MRRLGLLAAGVAATVTRALARPAAVHATLVEITPANDSMVAVE